MASEDSVSNPRYPFGLPMGTVRGILSLLICSFFWIVLLSSSDAKPPLAHYFLLALVLLAFASSPGVDDRKNGATLPWLMRALFLGGSAAVLAYCLANDADRFKTRITPNFEEVKVWWVSFMGCLMGGFAGGLFARVLLGRASYAFLTFRAWLSVVGMIMLVIELALFVSLMSADPDKYNNFFHTWQAIQITVVSAYFATRS